MAVIKGHFDVHRVTSISLDAIKEIEHSDGSIFCKRDLTIAFQDGDDLTIELFARDSKDGDDARDAFRCLEVLV